MIILYLAGTSVHTHEYVTSLLRVSHIFTTHSKLHKVQFLVLTVPVPFVGFLFVNQIYPELLNRFPPNSQGRRVWSLARTSLNVKVTRDKRTCCALLSPPGSDGMERARCKQCHAAANGTTPSLQGGHFCDLHAVCLIKHLYL